MPADPGTASRLCCPVRSDLADAELAEIVRSAADEDGLTGEFYTIALHASCALDKDHAGLHAGWIASTNGDDPETCWLRWDETARLIDWLTGCVAPDCLLYRGHSGTCDLVRDGKEAPSAR